MPPVLERAVSGAWQMATWPWERSLRARLAEDPEYLLRELFTNPVILAQANNELVIHPDWFLGHRLAPGREVIGRTSYHGLEEFGRKAVAEERAVIVSAGDSSTSGWNSFVAPVNRRRKALGVKDEVVLPFFHYPTYSDLLQEHLESVLPGQFLVINVGVPAHSSVQGQRWLAEVLLRLKRVGAPVAAVTLYYGNNDCAWNCNVGDEALLPAVDNGGWRVRVWEVIFQTSATGKILWGRRKRQEGWRAARRDTLVTRTSPREFKNALREMTHLCRKSGARPILIEPAVPIWWEPGTRIPGEDLAMEGFEKLPGVNLVRDRLALAKRMWRQGIAAMKSGTSNEAAEALLHEAAEADYVVPRIKRSHLRQLRNLALEEQVPVVRIDVPRATPDSRYFLDYCHPIGDANAWIAQGIAGELRAVEESVAEAAPSERAPRWLTLAIRILAGRRQRVRGPVAAGDADARIPDGVYTLS